MYLIAERALGRLLEGSRKVLETTFLYGNASFIIFCIFNTRDTYVGSLLSAVSQRRHCSQARRTHHSGQPIKLQVVGSPFHPGENQDAERQVRAQSHTADKWLSRYSAFTA